MAGEKLSYAEMKSWYDAFNDVITNYGGEITTLTPPAQGTKAQPSDVNNIFNKITEFINDEYLGTQPTLYNTDYSIINSGTIVVRNQISPISETVNKITAIHCRNKIEKSNATNSNGNNSNGPHSNGTNSDGVFSNGLYTNGPWVNGQKSNVARANGKRSLANNSSSYNSNGSYTSGWNSNGWTCSNVTCSSGANSNGVNSNGYTCSNGVCTQGMKSNGSIIDILNANSSY